MYPGHLWGLWLMFAIVLAVHFAEKTVPFALVDKFTILLDEYVYSVVVMQI